MALLSKLFGGDSLLAAAAATDAGHIVPGARGAHVAKIQEALNRLDGAAVAVDSQYGPKTAAAVAAFKTKRKILNASGRIDDIVGLKTMAALDREMLAKEKGGPGLANLKPGVLRVAGKPAVVIVPSFKPNEIAKAGTAPNPGGVGRRFGVVGAGDPSLQSLTPLIVEDFNEPADTFILSLSIELLTGPKGDKNDLDSGNPPRPALTFAETAAIEAGRQTVLTLAAFDPARQVALLETQALLESKLGAGPEGAFMMNTFFRNRDPGLELRFDVGSSFSNRVANSKGFQTELAGVTADITSALQAQFLTGFVSFSKMRGIRRDLPGKPQAKFSNPNGVKGIIEIGYDITEPDMVALVGSFQAATVFLNGFSVDARTFTFQATVRFVLIDHFGVDNSDVVFDFKGHGLPGQIAFWILQHEKRPGHIPFRYKVIVDKTITGSLLDPRLFPDLGESDRLKNELGL